MTDFITAVELAEWVRRKPRRIQQLAAELVAAGVATRVGSTTMYHHPAAMDYIINRPETRGRPKQ